ncbi:ABC transporter substrate-binding protein [Ferruginivarius sediminum]|nr:ABC transporter substrate-binding protein [Ferruginivarius sediminum]
MSCVNMRSACRRGGVRAGLAAFAFAVSTVLGAVGGANAANDDAPTIRFGVPTWPGVTVKSEVAAQLLEHMGYGTHQMNASPSVILNSLKTDDLDIYLGGWMPTEKEMIDPLVEAGEVETLTTNISDALLGVAVPTYVWEAGVRTEADLDKYAEKFDRKLYGIEAGSGTNKTLQDAIDADRHGLGDWELVQSSTSAMLAQVGRKIRKDEWIAFSGWRPHWMNITYDIKQLEAVGDSRIAAQKSDVLTVANVDFVERHPDLATFFSQYQIENEEQSRWILEYSYKEREAPDVAAEWIEENMDRVATFLDGVKARDGRPAIEAVREAVAAM